MTARVLIVDDALFMRTMLRNIFVESGFEVVGEAGNGNEAVEKFRALGPDLTTMDIVMPEKNGIEALKLIMAFDPRARVVMCSALGQESLIIEALEAGARDFIVKPFKPAKVVEVAQKVLAGARVAMDLSKYRQLFLDECREHLQVMNRELLRLEQEGAAGGVDALFRAAHSIKGMSGSMGYDAVVAVSHALEDILDRLRKKTLGVDPGLMTLLYEGVDSLGALVAEIEEKGATHLEVAGLAARLRVASQRRAAGARAAPAALETPPPEPAPSLAAPAAPAAPEAPRRPTRRSARVAAVPGAARPPRCPRSTPRRRHRPRTAAPIWLPPGAASSPSSRRSSRWCAILSAAASSPTPASCVFPGTRRLFAPGTSSCSAGWPRRAWCSLRARPSRKCAPVSAASSSRRCC